MRRLIALLLVASAAVVAVAATGKSDPFAPAVEVADKAMAKLRIDDATGFHTELVGFGLNPNKVAFEQMKEFRQMYRGRYGVPLGQVELIERATIGTSFLRLTYLDRHERTASVWVLTFYREADGWRVVGINWADEVRPLFKPAG